MAMVRVDGVCGVSAAFHRLVPFDSRPARGIAHVAARCRPMLPKQCGHVVV